MVTFYVSPDGKPCVIDGESRTCHTLSLALGRAGPGDNIRLAEGTYRRPVVLTRSGEPGQPIRLIGGPGVEFDGEQEPTRAKKEHLTPDEDDYHFLRLSECAWVEISGLSFKRCWPAAILGRGAKHVRIEKCKAEGGQFFIYLRNAERRLHGDIESHSIVLEDLQWTQDPERKMWKGKISWKLVKDPDDPASCMNGAFFGSFDIPGNIKMRRCRVSHAFNGVRMDARRGSSGTSGKNTNVQIEECSFDHIRDNAIEPEKTATSWWIRGCRFYNTHATFSLHNLTGGWIYLIGNRIWSDDKPDDPQNHTGGKTFKFLLLGAFPEGPICVLHNSFHLKSSYIKRGKTQNLIHANNAISFADPERSMFGGGNHFVWDDTYLFVGDVSNNEKFPDKFPQKRGYAIDGNYVESFFVDPGAGDFTIDPCGPLAPDENGISKIEARTVCVPLPDGTVYELAGDGLIGAVQRNGNVFDRLPYVPARDDWSLRCCTSTTCCCGTEPDASIS